MRFAVGSERDMVSSNERSGAWLSEFAARLGEDYTTETFHSLCAGLHAIRDRLPLSEVASLGDQMPIVIRGAFYASWRPAERVRAIESSDALYAELAAALEGRFAPSPRDLMRAVFSLLDARVGWEVIAGVRCALPDPIRAMWPRAG